MKPLIVSLLFILSSCASIHSVPENAQPHKTIEYCGGELWGYFLPIGPHEKTSIWKTSPTDPKPLMALYLHMHSIAEKDPEHSLTLHLEIRTKENLKIQFPDPTVTVQIDGAAEKKLPLEAYLVQDPLRVGQLYPDQEYKVALVDQKLNKWSVAKRNSVVNFISGQEQIVELPMRKSQKLSTEPVSVTLDEKKYSQIFVMASINLWPEGQPLRDARVLVHLPRFTVNDAIYDPQAFAFDTNYEKVKKDRASYGRCPSTDEIFRFNN